MHGVFSLSIQYTFSILPKLGSYATELGSYPTELALLRNFPPV